MLQESEHVTRHSNLSELCDFYFEVVAPITMKEHTIYNNRRLIGNYVLPFAGSIPICDLGAAKVDEIFCSLLTKGSPVTGKKLNSSSVKQTRMVLSAVMMDAVRKGFIESNPVEKSTPVKVSKESCAFLDEEMCRIVLRHTQTLRNPQVKRAIELLLMTGMRRGELVGLMWSDIDFERNELFIKRTASRFNKKTVITSPKSSSSERRIPLCSSAVRILRDQKEYVARLEAIKGNEWIKTETVFTGVRGGFLSGDYLNNCFREMMKDAGINGMHLHALRHANASILINEGVPMKVVSEHLGHSCVNVTEKFYIHMFSNSQKITADVMNKVFHEA